MCVTRKSVSFGFGNSSAPADQALRRILFRMGASSLEEPKQDDRITWDNYNGMCDSMPSSPDDYSDSISSSSSEFMDDVTSSPSSSMPPSSSSCSLSEHISDGSLYELPALMAQLRFRRGLSRYYEGKSQSFTSLSNVRCLEDLAKPESPYRRKMKSCHSYGGGLDHKANTPKPYSKIISKKSSRGSFASLLTKSSSPSHRPSFPLHKNL